MKLGNPRPETAVFHDRSLAVAAAAKSGETRGVAADEFARLIQPLLEGALAGKSANAIASVLNERGVMTARGGKWTARSVINIRARLEAAP